MRTILHKFYENAKDSESNTALIFKNSSTQSWESMSWKEALQEVQCLMEGLKSLGVQKGDFVAIFAQTRYEWTIIDLAILSIGAISVPIYDTLGFDQISYILNHSSSKVLFVENQVLLKKYNEIKGQLNASPKVVLIEEELGGRDIPTYKSFMEKGEVNLESYHQVIEKLQSGDVATVVYTSGTTGEQKGVLLTHSNIMGEVKGLAQVYPCRPEEVGLLFLPLAHVTSRAMQFFQIYQGCQIAYVESMDQLAANILEVKPHFMFVVPRVMEKMYEAIYRKLKSRSSFQRLIFHLSIGAGRRVSRRLRMQQSIPIFLKFKNFLAQKFVFSKLRKGMGGRLQCIFSGGAPLDRALAEFFHAIGSLVLEGYGLSETMAAVTMNRFDDFKFGTVGKPLEGVQVRIADDGEILIKGPQVFRKYLEPNAEGSQNDFEGEWFKTGDLGAFSKRGFLRITGRKKEIIITATGKNIAPQRVESVIKQSPYIDDVIVFGDRRKYLSGLVVVNQSEIKKYAKEARWNLDGSKHFAKDQRVRDLIKSEIESKNRELARHETIKKFCILNHDFTQEGGELTPTLKLKRQVIFDRYKPIIDQMYDAGTLEESSIDSVGTVF